MKLFVSNGNVVLIDINKNIRKSVEEIVGYLKGGKSIVIFPEGARTKDGKVAQFKKVFAIIAKELNVDVQCLGIKGGFEAYSRYMKFPKPKKSKWQCWKNSRQKEATMKLHKKQKTL